jgi:hypothetical protein
VLAASFALRAPQQARPPTTTASLSASDLISRAVAAKGGAAKLRSIETVKATATMTVSLGGRPVDLETVTSIHYPGSFRMDAKTPAGPLVQVFHNGEFWVQDARGSREAPQSVADEIRANVQRDSIGLLLGLLDRKLTASRVPDVQVSGHAMPAIRVTGASMPPLTVIFDPATALIVRQRYLAPAPQGQPPVDTEEEFSDFRDIDGLKVPFSAAVRVGGVVTVRRALHSVEYNVPLDASIFSRPI